MKDAPRIVTLDIETAPLRSYHWGLWDQNIGLNQIESEWSILSFSAKWLGERRVIYHDTGGRGASRVREDAELLRRLWKILDEADIVVTQNGMSFDIKKINARMIMNGLGPYSPIRQIDTKRAAARFFGFTSNKLAWLSEHLCGAKKSAHKKFPGFDLWEECLKDNPKAWAEMKRYNAQDVRATEELYLKLRPWIEGHPNVATYNDKLDLACPKCGSRHLQARGTARSQVGHYRRLQCQDCGGWSRSKYLLNTKAKRKSLLT